VRSMRSTSPARKSIKPSRTRDRPRRTAPQDPRGSRARRPPKSTAAPHLGSGLLTVVLAAVAGAKTFSKIEAYGTMAGIISMAERVKRFPACLETASRVATNRVNNLPGARATVRSGRAGLERSYPCLQPVNSLVHHRHRWRAAPPCGAPGR